MGRSCNQNGRSYECFQNLTGKPIGRHRHKWKGKIRIDLKEIGDNR